MVGTRITELKKDQDNTQAVVTGLVDRMEALAVQMKEMQELTSQRWERVQARLTAIGNEIHGRRDSVSNGVRSGGWRSEVAQETIVASKPLVEERGHPSLKLKFPDFNGSELEDWVCRSEQYFKLEQITEARKVRIASVYMYGKAFRWHYTFLKNRERAHVLTWTEYVDALIEQFGKAAKNVNESERVINIGVNEADEMEQNDASASVVGEVSNNATIEAHETKGMTRVDSTKDAYRKKTGGRTDVDVEADEIEEEEDEEGVVEFRRGESTEFRFDHTWPFEASVLSPKGKFPVIQVPASINCRLLEPHREGVKLLYRMYMKNRGGVLGDDMGMGKTIQTIAFFVAICGEDGELDGSKALKDHQLQKRRPVILICPTSVILNWESEFSKWSSFMVCIYHGANRELIREKLDARGVEVLITSFDTYMIHGGVLSDVKWEIVVVDDAHRLKNEKSKLYAACLEIMTWSRIGLTGTVIQNKIMELFNRFDWVAPRCWGMRKHFKEHYDEPLKMGQRSTAPEKFIHIADEKKQHLAGILRKYMLWRTKEETIGHLVLGKEDNVVFCAMSELQKKVYKRTLQLPDIQCLNNKDLPCSCGSPLIQVQCCKKIMPDGIIWPYLHRNNHEGCDSCPFCIVMPCLIKLQQISNHLELIKPNLRDEPDKQKKDVEFAAAIFADDIDMVGGDKVLLFSYSARTLEILEKFLIQKGYEANKILLKSLTDTYRYCGRLGLEQMTFKRTDQKNVVSWGVMIYRLTRNEELDKALEMLGRMIRERQDLSKVSVHSPKLDWKENMKLVVILHRKMIKRGRRATMKALTRWSNSSQEEATLEFLYDLWQKFSGCTLEDKCDLKQGSLMQGKDIAPSVFPNKERGSGRMG